MIEDENPMQEGEGHSEGEEEADAIRLQSERITAAALAYQAKQRALGRDISLTSAIIELLTHKAP